MKLLRNPLRLLGVSPADVVTMGNALCGFVAIALVARTWTGVPAGGELRLSDDDVVLAAGLIVAGAMLDTVDGVVARRFGSSGLGEHLELMGDVVTFGLAPTILFAVDAAAYGGPWPALALVVAAGYAMAVLLRLARYASHSSGLAAGGGRRLLRGLPSPPSAMAAVSVVLLHPPAPVALAAMTALAVLMLARFPFPRVSAATAPLMAAWYALAAGVVAGVFPSWPVAAFTLAMIGGLLVAGHARKTAIRDRFSFRRAAKVSSWTRRWRQSSSA
jgi:CDP-diacylglycerol--serine O-phosphatidyltransferase